MEISLIKASQVMRKKVTLVVARQERDKMVKNDDIEIGLIDKC